MSEAVIIAIITAVSSGIGGLFLWVSKRADKKLDAKLQERNQERDRINAKIDSLEAKVESTDSKLKKVAIIVAGCPNPDCKVKEAVFKELTE